jgi:hypothetical protein
MAEMAEALDQYNAEKTKQSGSTPNPKMRATLNPDISRNCYCEHK